MRILITGGAGFIGSHVVRRFVRTYPEYHIVNLDALTYAGNLSNLDDVSTAANYTFVKGNILDRTFLEAIFSKHRFEGIIHLAAESHVDRSIQAPTDFLQTNIQGTVNLLQMAHNQWEGTDGFQRFYHISTDEVFGSLGSEGTFNEQSPYAPNSPYAASKAAADHFVRAFGATYGLPFLISNCSNNFGPNQYPEKLIPLLIENIVQHKPLPIYGDGQNTRDWLFVEDHAKAIDQLFHKGKAGNTYCIGGDSEWKNVDLARLLCRILDRKLGRQDGSSQKLITFVRDRPGHDYRYAIDNRRIRTEIGWKPEHSFEEGLEKTIDWYLTNAEWLKRIAHDRQKE